MKIDYSNEVTQAARVIWDFMIVNHTPLHKADLIFVLGSRDDRVPTYAAELYHQGLAPLILVSGGVAHKNDLLKTHWQEMTEAEYFLKVLKAYNVPPEKVLLETQATNTGANVRFAYEVLKKSSLLPKSILLLQKPYMERRTYATFMKQWPQVDNIDVQVSSPKIPFEKYFNLDQPFDTVVSIMVGDLERIIEYPKMGYQIPQSIPSDVIKAQKFLVKEGFNNHLLQQ